MQCPTSIGLVLVLTWSRPALALTLVLVFVLTGSKPLKVLVVLVTIHSSLGHDLDSGTK